MESEYTRLVAAYERWHATRPDIAAWLARFNPEDPRDMAGTAPARGTVPMGDARGCIETSAHGPTVPATGGTAGNGTASMA